SETYSCTQACWAVLPPTAAEADGESPSWTPVRLSCKALRRAVARDAATVWRLRPGDAMSAPGFDGPRYQPGLLLSCLLSGACYVHTSLEEALTERRRPERTWRAFGVVSELRELWARQ